MRKVKLFNLRVNGNRIPQDVWNRVAEVLLPGPQPSESDIKHGKSKSAILKRLVATDGDLRSRAKKLSADLMTEDAREDARKAGWMDTDTKPDAAQDRQQWELSRVIALYDLTRTGTANERWDTPNGPVPLLSEAERAWALTQYACRKRGGVPGMGDGNLPENKTVPNAAPEYVPSGTDWNEVNRAALAFERTA